MNTQLHKFVIDGISYDGRSLAVAKEQKINSFKELTSQNIIEIEDIDLITQTNAALGVYDEDKTQYIKGKISYWRDRYIQAKESVMSANTNDEVDSVVL